MPVQTPFQLLASGMTLDEIFEERAVELILEQAEQFAANVPA